MGNAVPFTDHKYEAPHIWLQPNGALREEFRQWSWYPNGSLKIQREVIRYSDNFEMYSGSPVYQSAHYLRSENVLSLNWTDRGWALEMWHTLPNGKWGVRDVSVKLMGISEDGFFAKVKLVSRTNSGRNIDTHEHVFWRHRFI